MLRSFARQTALCATLLAAPIALAAESPLVRREAFANAHVMMMARSESGGQSHIADVEVWASGDKLRARVPGANGGPADEFWVDGLTSDALVVRDGKVVDPRRKSLEHGLQISLKAAPDLGNFKNDRIAGHPCKIITEQLGGGTTLTRCLWRGLPLSVELSGKGFAFNAAATLVEENRVIVADLQPPVGAPPAAKGLSATR